jgi:hypothetical protein
MRYLVYLSALLMAACSSGPDFEIAGFEPLSGFNNDTSNAKDLYLDYENALDSGFVIPSVSQMPGGYFTYRFSIKNNSGNEVEFFYKIYYQNESYAFELTDKRGKENPLAAENFYGSFEDPATGFLSAGIIPADGEFHQVEGSFRIVGNPRNEKKYYGVVQRDRYYQSDKVAKYEDAIRNTPDWLAAVQEKAKRDGLSLDEQIRLDAGYMVMSEREKDTLNQRWKRNPRTGSYAFMVAAVKKEDLALIPEPVKNINKVNEEGKFINPFYYFTVKEKKNPAIQSVVQNNLVHVKAKPDFSRGIYFNRAEYTDQPYSKDYFSSVCGGDSSLYHNAHMQQFFHKLDSGEFYYNIPVLADVQNDGYSMEDYKKNALTDKTERLKSLIRITDCPCKTVGVDSLKRIFMTNPAAGKDRMVKENVGVFTRHGLTYGKYRVKIQMPGLLNKYHVWNGLTNAVWMIGQSPEAWNYRRPCNKKGYIPKHVNAKDSGRVAQLGYTEIDFEILKCNRYWPVTSYGEMLNTPKEGPEDVPNIVVTCTNWDMACPDPPDFNIGYHEYTMLGKKWGLHRWDTWHQAITAKYPTEDIFDYPYYYLEIEWNPREIIWRIGPEKDKLQVVAYVNDSISNIPENQMLLVFTQEFHVGRWWPESAMPQENIPFNLKDITGYILEIEIE